MSTEAQMIHIGPHRSESIELHQRTDLPITVLAPDPLGHDAALPNQQQVRALVAPEAGEATRYRYNLPGFDSLAPATGLQALYPGLREIRRQPVETCTLAEVLHEQGMPAVTHLVLEQPDNALALLQAWQEGGLLDQLQSLHVRTSSESLYRGMATQAELCAWCEKQGFELAESTAEDPEFALVGFKRNALYTPLQEARQQAQALQAELAERQAQRDEYKALLEQNARQLQEAAGALRESEAALQQRAEEASAFQKERDALIQERDQLKQQRDDQAQAREAAQAERESLKQERDALKQERDTLKQERDQLKQQRDEQTQAREAAQAERESLKQERDKLKAARDAANKEAEALKTKLSDEQKVHRQTEEKLQQTHDWFMSRKQQVEESTKQLKALQAEKSELQKALDEQAGELEKALQERDQFQRYFQNRKQEHEAAKTQLEETRQAQAEKDAVIARLSEQLTAQQQSSDTTQSRFAELESKLETLFGDQRHYIQQTTSALGQHVTRQSHATIDSVQTCIEAQKALGASGQALSYDGKSLPHASALLLNRTLENGSYDVVLDIGTGVTTAFLASALQQRGAEQRRIAQRHRSGSSEGADGQLEAYTVAEAGELPKRLQAFTHSREQGQAMRDHLQRKGLEPLAGVHLTPLVEVATAGQTALFYDLARSLQRLADLFDERTARVLVVCAMEQQPASASVEALLPLLLQHLASHTLQLVVLPAPDAESGELQRTWAECLQARELPHELKEDARSRAWTLTVNG